MLEGKIDYTLYSNTDSPLQFSINLDFGSVTYAIPHPDFAPSWTQLEHNKCSICPLSSDTHPLCPLAERLVPFLNRLSSMESTENIQVTIQMHDREIIIKASAQNILGSLLGLFIATSDCPHTLFLRPMAHTHVPLADMDETMYRILSMYRLAQYYRKKQTGIDDPGFLGLVSYYEKLNEINKRINERMRTALKEMDKDKKSDGTLNALSILDAIAQYISLSIEEGVDELGPMFDAYCTQCE